VNDGSNPPLCHLHNGAPLPSPILPPADEVDEMKTLKRLAHDRDPQIRLRAVDLLIKIREKADKKDDQCPQCAARRRDAEVYRRFTDEQRDEAYAVLQRWRAIKAAAATQPIQPGADYV
jgi:hypothetical protein